VIDEVSFDELYLATRDRLIAQIYVFTSDETEARDLVQQAFERAWIHWRRVSKLADPEAWVRLVAFNLAKNHRRWRRHVSVQPVVPEKVSDPIADEQSLIEFGQALARVAPDQRRALILYHLVGLSVAEIAAEMSAPSGTVMSWLYRGRAQLAAELERLEAIDPEDSSDD
jgi:RNA polymerase sigma-70 factor (ECF subfamily)